MVETIVTIVSFNGVDKVLMVETIVRVLMVWTMVTIVTNVRV